MDKHLAANRQMWDALAQTHVQGHPVYPVQEFIAGRAGVVPNIPDDIGPVTGTSLLHLQCHFGMDSLMWVRQGARVTGVDFSPVAIAAAHALARDTNLEATFIESDIATLPDKLDTQFDIVMTYYGTIPWLPDLTRWGEVIAHFLTPGGFVYLADTHRVAALYEWDTTARALTRVYDYCAGEPVRFESDRSYANPAGPARVSYEWFHSMDSVTRALTDAGLEIAWVHEFPYTFYDMFYDCDPSPLEQDDAGWWRFPEGECDMPLMFSLKAVRGL